MDELVIPYAFTGGLSAKAQEVNVNFDQIRKFGEDVVTNFTNTSIEIQKLQSGKANLNGNEGIVFNVAQAVEAHHAVPLYQLQNLILPMKYIIGGLTIEKGGNQSIIIRPGACYDSTYTYPMQLDTNIAELLASYTNKTFDVYVMGNPVTNPNKITRSSVVDEGTMPQLQVGEVYRKIGSFSFGADGNIDENTIKKEGN